MATAEVNTRPQPLFWRHVASWISSIPRAALLSMVGPLILCVVGYFGWRYYGASKLDRAYYGLKKENIHITAQPKWLKNTNVLDEVFASGALANLTLLDSQTPVTLAKVFDAHPCVRKTLRVQKMAGQVMINLEYRQPVAMVCFRVQDDKKGQGKEEYSYLPVDTDSVLLDTKNFSYEDVSQYISIYPLDMEMPSKLLEGQPLGDTRVEEAVRLCTVLLPYREGAKITRVYVYDSRQVGKTRWLMELETSTGTRVTWGSAPGLEGLGEKTAQAKLEQLRKDASDSARWSNGSIDLTGLQPRNSRE